MQIDMKYYSSSSKGDKKRKYTSDRDGLLIASSRAKYLTTVKAFVTSSSFSSMPVVIFAHLAACSHKYCV